MHRSNHRRRRHRGTPPYVDPAFAEHLSAAGGQHQKRSEKEDHKTRQLCRQVERALNLALGGECNDDLLRELLVESVVPFPNASRLLARVVVPKHLDDVPLADVMARLNVAAPLLRRLVAQAITRKRAPELSFVSVPWQEVLP